MLCVHRRDASQIRYNGAHIGIGEVVIPEHAPARPHAAAVWTLAVPDRLNDLLVRPGADAGFAVRRDVGRYVAAGAPAACKVLQVTGLTNADRHQILAALDRRVVS